MARLPTCFLSYLVKYINCQEDLGHLDKIYLLFPLLKGEMKG